MRCTVILAATTAVALISVCCEARDVARGTQHFGTVSYTEVITSRGKGEPSFVGIPDRTIELSLRSPLPIGMLTIEDSALSMTFGITGDHCRVATPIDGYRDLSIAEIEHRVRQLRSGCGWSDAAVANTLVIIDRRAGDLRQAISHMRQRAIVLLGSDLRCDPNLPPRQPSQRPTVRPVSDGTPPALCSDAAEASGKRATE